MGPQQAFTRDQAIEIKTQQITAIEKELEGLRHQTQHMRVSADLMRSAENDFETFEKDPGLGNILLLARGLKKFCRVTRTSTEESVANIVKRVNELNEWLPKHKEELARIESGIITPTAALGQRQ